MDMLKRLGIDPQPTDRDPFGHVGTQQVMVLLEKVRDFPPERLPEIEEYAKKVEVLNPEALIKKMRAVKAQAPAKRIGYDISDEAIEKWELSRWQAIEHANRNEMFAWGQEQYDYLKGRYDADNMAVHRDNEERSASPVVRKQSKTEGVPTQPPLVPRPSDDGW